ncbi:MAG: hypothetical protein KIT84_08300 [Labilithrix sp.]|nr:hypothetical protein [Labilithrix sp.]MCW5810998.1 hypothetical protein [Labilithrix sp.]
MRATASRLTGSFRVGADFFARQGLVVTDGAAPRGVVDRVADLANAAVDTARIDPALVPFFEETSALDLRIRSRWRFPFSIGWRLARVVARWIGQLVLPRHEARIRTEAFAIDAARDGRADVRAIVRTYADTGEVFQAMAYATWERGGTRYMSAAFPLPFGCLMGLLRLDAIARDGDVVRAVALTSAAQDGDDAGVWLTLGRIAIPLPLGERLELWAPGTEGAPDEPPPEGAPPATILGRHVQTCFGVRVVTHHYWFCPS